MPVHTRIPHTGGMSREPRETGSSDIRRLRGQAASWVVVVAVLLVIPVLGALVWGLPEAVGTGNLRKGIPTLGGMYVLCLVWFLGGIAWEFVKAALHERH